MHRQMTMHMLSVKHVFGGIYMSRACQSQEIVLDLVVRKSTPYRGDPGRPAKMVSHKQ